MMLSQIWPENSWNSSWRKLVYEHFLELGMDIGKLAVSLEQSSLPTMEMLLNWREKILEKDVNIYSTTLK